MYLGGIDDLFGVNRPSVSLLFLHIFIYKNKIDHMKLMTKRDLEQRLELTKLRYERQEIRLYVLLQSMQNNRDNIKQIEYALLVMERVSTQRRRHRIIPNAEILDFITYASCVYDRLQSHLHKHLNYSYFCSVICCRYLFESRRHIPGRRFLNYNSVLSYFKRERGR
jgi:hypothetical protein